MNIQTCKYILITIICNLIVTGVACAQNGKTYYVSPDGDDKGGDGSSAKPWATPGAALKRVPEDGGTIFVRDGTYEGVVRITRRFSRPLLLRAENPFHARLQNGKELVLSITGTANVEVAGFDISRLPPTGKPGPLAVHIARSQKVTLRNNLVHDSYNNDLLKINEQSNEIVIIGNIFHNQEGGAGQHIDVNGCTDVTILENIFFNDFARSGISGSNAHGFIVIKNSDSLPESRRIQVAGNIFMNFEGGTGSNFILLGEDGKPMHEVQEVLIENNLMIGNSPNQMRAPLGVKGARDIIFRNNTITGDLPARAYAMRLNREGRNPTNQNLLIVNNVWSDPTGTMGNFSDGQPEESALLKLNNNAYWNGGKAVPETRILQSSVLQPSMDKQNIQNDPKLPWPKEVTLPHWNERSFWSGTTSFRQEFERLVKQFGVPAAGSSLVGRAEPGMAPAEDILGRKRSGRPDIGAVQSDGAESPLRILLLPGRLMGGRETSVNRIMLEAPAPAGGATIALTSSQPSLVSVPAKVSIPAGEDSVAFAVKTQASGEGQARLTASWKESKAEALVSGVLQGIASINPLNSTVWAGTSDHRIMLEGPVTSGVDIKLSSSRPDLITFPKVEPVPGRSYAVFTMHSKPVTQETSVDVMATVGKSSRSANIQIRPGQAVTSLKLSKTHAYNGEPLVATIAISEPGTNGNDVVVQMKADNPAVVVPEPVRIPSGEAMATVPIELRPMSGRVSVGVAASVNGNTRTEWVVIGWSQARGLGLRPPKGGRSVGELYITVPAASPGLRCSVSSSRPDMASVPPEVVVNEGKVYAQIPITLSPSFDPAAVTISATCGEVTKTAHFPSN